MLLHQTQLDVDAKILKSLELFGYFVAVIYAKHWFKAPVGAEAAGNDLLLYKLLVMIYCCTGCCWLMNEYQYLKTYLLLHSQHKNIFGV